MFVFWTFHQVFCAFPDMLQAAGKFLLTKKKEKYYG